MTTAVDSTSQDDGWASMSAVGNFLNNTDACFDPRNYGFPKLSSLARAQDYLEVKQGAGQRDAGAGEAGRQEGAGEEGRRAGSGQ